MNCPPRLLLSLLSLKLLGTSLAAEEPRGSYLLVANKGDSTLSIVDVAAGREIAALPEGGKTGHEVAASPDGRRAYVPIYGDSGVGRPGTDGSLLRVFDLGTRALVGTVDFGHGVRPHRPVFGPKDGLLYVTTELEQSVTLIDPVSLKIIGAIPTGQPQSHMLVISRDGLRGYTCNVGAGSVSVLDLAARKLVMTISVAPLIQRISLSIDDRWAFTADQTALRLVVIDTATNSVSRSIPLPGLGFGTTPTPDGRALLVTLPATNQVGLVDLNTFKVVNLITVPRAPQEIVVSPDGANAYVSCDAAKQVAVIDLKTWKLGQQIEVGAIADGLAWVAAR